MSNSPRDYAEMYYCYGVTREKTLAAARMYREQLIRRGGPQPEVYPDYRVFLRVQNAYMEGRIPGTNRREGTPMIDTGRAERVLEAVQREPSECTRGIACFT